MHRNVLSGLKITLPLLLLQIYLHVRRATPSERTYFQANHVLALNKCYSDTNINTPLHKSNLDNFEVIIFNENEKLRKMVKLKI